MIRALLAVLLIGFGIQAQGAHLIAGAHDAKAQVLIYGDLQCPYTAKVMTYLDAMKAEYGSRIGVLYGQFPLAFHKEGKPSAIAAACAGFQGEFAPFIAAAFAGQKSLSRAFYLATAQSVGVKDLGAFATCLESPEAAALVEADMAAGTAIGVTSTPNIFVNGQLIKGAYPYEQFKAAIDKALAN